VSRLNRFETFARQARLNTRRINVKIIWKQLSAIYNNKNCCTYLYTFRDGRNDDNMLFFLFPNWFIKFSKFFNRSSRHSLDDIWMCTLAYYCFSVVTRIAVGKTKFLSVCSCGSLISIIIQRTKTCPSLARAFLWP
jgi:hypothetical protein